MNAATCAVLVVSSTARRVRSFKIVARATAKVRATRHRPSGRVEPRYGRQVQYRGHSLSSELVTRMQRHRLNDVLAPGLSAAASAMQAGAHVGVLERAVLEERGGNTRWTEALMRMKSEK